MANITKLQKLLTQYFKHIELDEAAILFIMLALKSVSAQEAMVLYLRDNPMPTQEELMEAAVELQTLSEQMGLQ